MMCLTKPMFGCLLILLNFQGVLSDAVDPFATCPLGGSGTSSTFDLRLKDVNSYLAGFIQARDLLLKTGLFGESSLQNLTRGANCDNTIEKFCNPDRDTEICALSRLSICVRKETADLKLFEDANAWSKVVVHDYHCDSNKNKMYYAFALRRVYDGDSEWPPNFEPEVKIVVTDKGVKLMTGRFYFFHYLPDIAPGSIFYSVGFIYVEIPLVAGVIDGVLNLVDTITADVLNLDLVNLNINLSIG